MGLTFGEISVLYCTYYLSIAARKSSELLDEPISQFFRKDLRGITHSRDESMKRKLNEENIPEVVDKVIAGPETQHVGESQINGSFADMQLDPRLLQAIAKEKFVAPTDVQAKAIPFSLEGKDVLGALAPPPYRGTNTNSSSSGQNRIWQDRSIHTSNFAVHYPS